MKRTLLFDRGMLIGSGTRIWQKRRRKDNSHPTTHPFRID